MKGEAMKRISAGLTCATLLILATGCSQADREKADRKAAEAEAKLRRGGAELRDAGGKAGVKLDQASIIAKVKAKLATDVGLSAAATVDVDANGQVVTLRGTVASDEQKRQAERSAANVDGVTAVVNHLTVKP
jgi:osmotically-inducible protein OsmY